MLVLLEGKLTSWHVGQGKTVHLLRRTLPEVAAKSHARLTRGSEAQRGGEDVVSADICAPAVHRVKKGRKRKKRRGVEVRSTRLGSRHDSNRTWKLPWDM